MTEFETKDMKTLEQNDMYIGFDPDNKKEVEDAKQWYQLGRAHGRVIKVEDNAVASFREVLAAGGFVIGGRALGEGSFALRIHDDSGDRRLVFDSANVDEVAEAATLFEEYLTKGWRAYLVDKAGKKYRRIHRFDPHAEELLIEDQKIGVKLRSFADSFKEVLMQPKTYRA